MRLSWQQEEPVAGSARPPGSRGRRQAKCAIIVLSGLAEALDLGGSPVCLYGPGDAAALHPLNSCLPAPMPRFAYRRAGGNLGARFCRTIDDRRCERRSPPPTWLKSRPAGKRPRRRSPSCWLRHERFSQDYLDCSRRRALGPVHLPYFFRRTEVCRTRSGGTKRGGVGISGRR